ncbi:MAG TPA: transcription antitermination factor NusB [Acidimicrobiales bacterium]|nr:transcription antitermination factor NusB [Acidimicrobiales bacterium]
MSTSREPERPPGPRHQARERALHLLYEAEAKGETPEDVLAGLPAAPDPYARSLVAGVGGRAGEIDALVAGHASGWELTRMPVVDRQVLRLAAYELLAEPEVPAAVVIDEAVELAKEYSTEESGRYVNGVLAAIARRLGRLAAAGGAAGAAPAGEPPAGRDGTPPGPEDAAPERDGTPPGPEDTAAGRGEPPPERVPQEAPPRPPRPGAIGSVRPARRR